jgi:D-alanyl-D-alanine dipeptidase
MRKILLLGGMLLAFGSSCQRRSSEALVDVRHYAPKAILDIRYATPNNFTHERVYDVAACFLREATAERLSSVERNLLKKGLTLRIFDCYRPLSVQQKFWALVPDDRYVADPSKGSRHNRGAAVDLTIANLETGKDLDMGTGFDDFSDKAHRNYSDLPPTVLANRLLLEQFMAEQGFSGLPTEWWHFDDKRWSEYPISDMPIPKAGSK